VSGPLPPSDLASRRPSITRLRAGTVIHRFYSAKHNPIFFDRGRGGRLNAPDRSYGVLYAAKKPAGAFAETFLRNAGNTQFPLDLLGRKAYVRLKVTGALSLLQLVPCHRGFDSLASSG
jgi:RES domain